MHLVLYSNNKHAWYIKNSLKEYANNKAKHFLAELSSFT